MWFHDGIEPSAGPTLDRTPYRLRHRGGGAPGSGRIPSPVLWRGALPAEFAWDEIGRLPRTRVVRDFHCVTTWSVRAVAWEGVAATAIVDFVGPDPNVRWVLATGRDSYTTNMPYEAFARPDTLLADRMDGAPLRREHGFPLRLVVPSLYAWKSAKYVETIEFRRDVVRGFWEQRGYHDRGDPWREEQFREPGT